jgi:hypothetical protein
MAAEKDRIVNATTDALRAFWPDFVSECVRASGNELSELPREEVARIKAEVAAITEDPASAARERLVRPEWPHERDADELTKEEASSTFAGTVQAYEWLPHKSRGPEQPPSRLDGAVKAAAATPARPLVSADLQTPRVSRSSDKPLTAYDFAWTEEMLRASEAYGELVVEFQGLVRELRDARKNRDQNDAQDLWDNA